MSDEITAAIITGLATIVASFGGFNLYQYIKNFKKKNLWHFLIGTWDCNWVSDNGNSLEDIVTIKKIKGSKILGKEYGPKGPYDIWGELTLNSILITFKGESSKFDYAGVCLSSSKPENKSKMEGKWLQI